MFPRTDGSDIRLTDSEYASLENCQSDVEWNSICDRIKEVRGGIYPSDWFPRVLASGLMRRVSSRWGGTDQIRVIGL
jgi:hypothetical protein